MRFPHQRLATIAIIGLSLTAVSCDADTDAMSDTSSTTTVTSTSDTERPAPPVAALPFDDTSIESTSTSTTLLVAPVLSDSDQALADLEGRWMCDVQRQTFAQLSDMTDALQARLDGVGISMDEYDAFKARVGDEPDLRTGIRAVFNSYC